MLILADSDETKSTSRLNLPVDVIWTELEQETGADIVIGNAPIQSINWHIENGSYFIQRKSGTDMINSLGDHLSSSIARMKKCGIPKDQSVLAVCGQFSTDFDDNIYINNELISERVKYYNLQVAWSMWKRRGGIIWFCPTEQEILSFAKAELRAIEKCQNEPQKSIYPPKQKLYDVDQGLFEQQIYEIPPDDLRSILVCGIPGFGQKRAESLVQYLKNKHMSIDLYNAFHVLTLLDDKGKYLHKIPDIGKVTQDNIRTHFGLKRYDNCHWNLAQYLSLGDKNIRYKDQFRYEQGWIDALEQFRSVMIHHKKKGDASVSLLDLLETTKRYCTEFLILED